MLFQCAANRISRQRTAAPTVFNGGSHRARSVFRQPGGPCRPQRPRARVRQAGDQKVGRERALLRVRSWFRRMRGVPRPGPEEAGEGSSSRVVRAGRDGACGACRKPGRLRTSCAHARHRLAASRVRMRVGRPGASAPRYEADLDVAFGWTSPPANRSRSPRPSGEAAAFSHAGKRRMLRGAHRGIPRPPRPFRQSPKGEESCATRARLRRWPCGSFRWSSI